MNWNNIQGEGLLFSREISKSYFLLHFIVQAEHQQDNQEGAQVAERKERDRVSKCIFLNQRTLKSYNIISQLIY